MRLGVKQVPLKVTSCSGCSIIKASSSGSFLGRLRRSQCCSSRRARFAYAEASQPSFNHNMLDEGSSHLLT